MDEMECLLSPRLQIPLPVWQQMMAYITTCPTEINGFGLVEEVHPNLFFLSNIFITEQVASAVHVEVDPGVIGTMMTDMVREGEDPTMLKFQWHSHVSMPAYFSSTDTENIENWPGDWLISLVANKRGEYSCRMDTFKGPRIGITLQPEIISLVSQATMASTAREVARKVKRPSLLKRQPGGDNPATASRWVGIGHPENLQPPRETN